MLDNLRKGRAKALENRKKRAEAKTTIQADLDKKTEVVLEKPKEKREVKVEAPEPPKPAPEPPKPAPEQPKPAPEPVKEEKITIQIEKVKEPPKPQPPKPEPPKPQPPKPEPPKPKAEPVMAIPSGRPQRVNYHHQNKGSFFSLR